VTFEIKRDVVEEKLDEWMQVCTSHEQCQPPSCAAIFNCVVVHYRSCYGRSHYVTRLENQCR